MNRLIAWMLTLICTLSLAACGGGGGSDRADTGSNTTGGTAKFDINLAALTSPATASPAALYSTSLVSPASSPVITRVAVRMTRAGYDDINQDLAIVSNVASGSVSGLAAGYWHVEVDVYSDAGIIFSGQSDVRIIKGVTVNCAILFDPVTPPEPDTGSVDIVVGLNPVPGFKRIEQFVSDILLDASNGKLYILDTSSPLIAVYDAATLIREKDIELAAAPQAVALDYDGGNILLGYSSGKIYSLDVATETVTFVADSLISITGLVALANNNLFVASSTYWSSSNGYKTISMQTGQVLSTMNYWYGLSHYTLNPANGMIYALDNGVSPSDIHRIQINSTTGAITAMGDSPYHGSYSLGGPLRIISDGSRVITASGNMFVSSLVAADNLTFAGNLGISLKDIASDDVRDKLYVLNRTDIQKLIVIDQSTLFVTQTLELPDGATSEQVFNTPDHVIVIMSHGSDYYMKAYSKADLGLD